MDINIHVYVYDRYKLVSLSSGLLIRHSEQLSWHLLSD